MLADPEASHEVTRTTAIQKAVRLLQAISTSEEPQQLVHLAEQLDMPKPSVHRLLAQLEEVGMVGRDLGGRGYTVGATFLRLAIDAMTVRARQPVIRGIMRKLVDRVRESCNLGMLQDHEVIYIERVECDWPLRMQLQAGSRVPLHCTASGKMFLAQMSPGTRQRLLAGLALHRFTNNTIVDAELLEEECKTIRTSGVSTNKEEYHLGLIGVAVPVLRRDQTVIATLSIHAPSFRMSVETALSYVPLLQKSAIEIASEVGFDELHRN